MSRRKFFELANQGIDTLLRNVLSSLNGIRHTVKISLLAVALNGSLRTRDSCCFENFHHFSRR
jgi:hypothetical protein